MIIPANKDILMKNIFHIARLARECKSLLTSGIESLTDDEAEIIDSAFSKLSEIGEQSFSCRLEIQKL